MDLSTYCPKLFNQLSGQRQRSIEIWGASQADAGTVLP